MGRELASSPTRRVHVVRDRLLGDFAVLKLASDAGPDAADLRHEARLHTTLEHPGLVPLRDVFSGAAPLPEDDSFGPVTGLATAWIDADPITTALAQRPLEERVASVGALVRVVAYLHGRGVLHLDLKPLNVLLPEDGPVVLDLGSARPLDAGPGEAGGTLGYAAPEVLRGEAASVASDLYSVGAILYEVIAGAPAHGSGLGPGELRQAVLRGEVVPLRVAASGLSRELASLVGELLAYDPQRRPRSAEEVLQQLVAAGCPVPPLRPGAPPFVGRTEELQLLSRWVSSPGPQVVVAGEPGSGRRRLAREALWRLALAGGTVVDVSDHPDPVRVVHRQLVEQGLVSEEAEPHTWSASLLEGGRTLPKRRVTLFLGVRAERSTATLDVFDAVAPYLRVNGVGVVWVSVAGVHGYETVSLGPLEPDAVEALGRYLGLATASEISALVLRAGAHPGRLVAAASQGGAVVSLSAAVGATLHRLAALPAGIPPLFLARLPEADRQHLPLLRLHGQVRRSSTGHLLVLHLAPSPTFPEEYVAPLLAASSQPEAHEDALFFGLALARAGQFELAARFSASAVEARRDQRSEVLEFVRLLAAAHNRDAARHLARLSLDEGMPRQALDTLEGLAAPTEEERLLRARAWRRLNRPDAALELLDGLVSGEAWLERARIAVEGNLDDAERFCEAGRRAGASYQDVLLLQLNIAIRRVREGAPPNALVPLIDEIEALPDTEQDAKLLSVAGRAARQANEPQRAVSLLQRATARADREGARRMAISVRTNLATAYQALGQGRAARQALEEAIQSAIAVDARRELIVLRYNLANLELLSGRLPAAARELDDLRRLVEEGGTAPEARPRVALLQAELHLRRGHPEAAEAELARTDDDASPREVRESAVLLLAEVRLQQGRLSDMLSLLDRVESAREGPRAELLRGRAHLALARGHLSTAVSQAPAGQDLLSRQVRGQVLLAAAGEDLDPDGFAFRRERLTEAASLLAGEPAARALSVRDRLLAGPGAALETIVGLTEAFDDPARFPRALARVVREALGTHRVLIMLRLPGLGNQLAHQELSGEEAAGIATEVLARIRSPEDVWHSDNAFADPSLRQVSATVRTFELKSLLAVAIPYRNEAIGALYVDDRHRVGRFTDDDVRSLQRLAIAVGRGVGTLPRNRSHSLTSEPERVLGVRLPALQARAIQSTLDRMRQGQPTNLLITGPTGSGKTWFARRVATEVLGLTGVVEVALRPGSVDLMVAQLQGARKGEYTGAVERVGAVHRSITSKKALFLDEVQALQPDQQQILLPLLDVPHRRMGGLTGAAEPVPDTLHIILCTNAPVHDSEWRAHFRDDLWYRMARMWIDLPALGDRGPEVVYRYLGDMLGVQGLPEPEKVFATDALARVTWWEWPGNLRELEGFADAAANRYRAQGERPLDLDDLRELGLGAAAIRGRPTAAPRWDDEVKVEKVLGALRRHDYVQRKAAAELGMSPASLSKFLKRHGLTDGVRKERQAKG